MFRAHPYPTNATWMGFLDGAAGDILASDTTKPRRYGSTVGPLKVCRFGLSVSELFRQPARPGGTREPPTVGRHRESRIVVFSTFTTRHAQPQRRAPPLRAGPEARICPWYRAGSGYVLSSTDGTQIGSLRLHVLIFPQQFRCPYEHQLVPWRYQSTVCRPGGR